ncbi:MAG: cell division protein FtsQ/DivIB [Amaricoccus sp.]|uniref:cell division protein FtsQ/DivIB n=1 Tax=Amaricoccus sp. TaxID=1872485 RepID=UPI0039E44A43
MRRAVNFGVPLLAGLLASWTIVAQFDARARVVALAEELHEKIVDRPQFTITAISVPGVSRDLAEQIRVAAFVRLPASSLELDVNAVRERIEALDAVQRARVRALPSGILEIQAVERVPVVVWRAPGGIELLDSGGVRVAEVDSRMRRPDLPLIAGDGAAAHVPEALALLKLADPVGARVRGLVRVGDRRWDLVLDRDQVVKLPEDNPTAALGQVMALEASAEVLKRDVSVIDMRDPARPVLRLTERAVTELKRLKTGKTGEDA